VVVGGQVLQKSVGILMGTNCAPLLADLFLYSYEAECIKNFNMRRKNILLWPSIFTFRYIDDVLSINHNKFHSSVDSIYPNQLEIKDITECSTSALYLDVLLKWDINGKIKTQLYDKQDDFNFSIVNLPHPCSNIPASPACGVYSICMILHDIRSVFSSRQPTDKQIDVTRVSTVFFTGSYPQILWSLQQSCLPIQPFFGQHVV
jgi:hypothetical protein